MCRYFVFFKFAPDFEAAIVFCNEILSLMLIIGERKPALNDIQRIVPGGERFAFAQRRLL